MFSSSVRVDTRTSPSAASDSHSPARSSVERSCSVDIGVRERVDPVRSREFTDLVPPGVKRSYPVGTSARFVLDEICIVIPHEDIYPLGSGCGSFN